MGAPYRTVRLLRNRIYPTYQLHACMANKKTAPEDGLRLAALLTMEWLRYRLGDSVPPDLQRVPEPSFYRECGSDSLPSLHLNCGYVVDIISMPERGVWTLQITEPDLGSDPGNPEQRRQAVPGRVIETNVAFKIVGEQLECGFQTAVSDPEGTAEPAEVYRLAVVRQLLEHPAFGLRQITALTAAAEKLETVEQLKNLQSLCRDGNNQLPCVVFTHVRREEAAPPPELPPLGGFLPPSGFRRSLTPPAPAVQPPRRREAVPPPYDIAGFARSCAAFCRTYLLADSLLERFAALWKLALPAGSVAILEPRPFGGAVSSCPYSPNKGRQEEVMRDLLERMRSYPRGRAVDFGAVSFLSAARENLLLHTQDALQRTQAASGQWAETQALLDEQWRAALQAKEDELSDLKSRLAHQSEYQAQLGKEKAELRQKLEEERAQAEVRLAAKDEDIAYLRRKLGQPREHEQIAAWVEKNFSGRLLLHPKAVGLLEERSARTVDIGLICDALDFLATDYWANRYERISDEEMLTRCSEKYGRPFEVTPVGSTTIEFTPSQYKIKYFLNARGKPAESPLNFHLRVGNDPENLLRIYFLHDDEKKLIVVGSLPGHLRAVTIK